MLFGFFWGDWTVLILIPGMILALWAQMRVNSTFEKYSRVITRSGLTAAESARRMLDRYGLNDVLIERVSGRLTDHYDPRGRVLRLSEDVYDSRSAAAVGVACHEAGHAIQHAESYGPLQLRMAIIPVCNIGSRLAIPLFLIGLMFAGAAKVAGGVGDIFMTAGILCFSASVLFQAVTLPVEFNASRRAVAAMEESGLLYGDEELDGAKSVLRAAALTYVAALVTALLSLLRLVMIANSRRK